MNEAISSQKEKVTKIVTPFEIHSGFEMTLSAPENIPYLVNGLLLEVGVSMLTAKPKCGKSTFGRALAVSIAEGRDFLGKPTLCGDVLYLNLEGPRGVLQQEFKKLGLSGQRGAIHVVDERPPLSGELGLQKLEKTIQSLEKLPRLVIVDTAAKLLRLIDSYDPNQVGLAIEELETIAKKYKLHLMFLTHAKKKESDDIGDSAMGSTSFRGGSDTNIFLQKKGAKRIISTEQRWGVGIEPTLLLQDSASLELCLGNTVESEEDASIAAKSRRTKDRIRREIVDALCLNTKLMRSELLAAVTGKTETIAEVIEEMIASGQIAAEPIGRAMQYQWIELPTESKAA